MKKYRILIILLSVLSGNLMAQDITGTWNGVLSVKGMEIRIELHVIKNQSGYSSLMDSPDQGAKGIQVDSTFFENTVLRFVINKGKIEYEGKLNTDNKIVGTFKQGGQWLSLDFGREIIESTVKLLRSQEPVKPYPYYSEEVKFKNKNANITLAGTLTMPQKNGKFPVVVLISGSGPENRDEEVFGHKPFLILADYLTRKGMAVLRFDDRGTAESTGDFKSATTEDFADDVLAAVEFLKKRKDIDKMNIGLIGHSEGGVIAPMAAARSEDINYIILLAGTGIKGSDLLLMQTELICRSQGMSDSDILDVITMNKGAYDIITSTEDTLMLKKALKAYYTPIVISMPEAQKPEGATTDEIVNMYVNQLSSPWMRFFLKYDPSLILKDVKCPVLALNGGKDLQVPSKENLEAIRAGLEKGNNLDVTIKEFPEMNHLFQECITGAIEEYAGIDQTISPVVLMEIAKWLAIQVNH